MKRFTLVLLVVAAACAPALAAESAKPAEKSVDKSDESDKKQSRPLNNTLALEVMPEWSAATYRLVDAKFRAAYSHSFGTGRTWGLSGYVQPRATGTRQYLIETTLGHTWTPMDHVVSFPLGVGIGAVADDIPASDIQPATSWAFYAFYAGMNWKLSPAWTWNVINARYRNALEGGWVTPKVSTGFTFTIDSRNALYSNVGHDWKNGDPDKVSLAFGYRRGF
jgi:hypothetical protein